MLCSEGCRTLTEKEISEKMGSQKMVAVVVTVVVAAELAVVAGNYSIATGGIKAAADEMRGDTAQASDRLAQSAQETKEVVGNWAGWAKEKVQHGLGLSINHSAGPSEVGQQIADKTRKGKEKAYQTMYDATQKASEKAQKAKEVIYETAKEAMGKAQVEAQWVSKKALEIKDKAQHHTETTAQENTAKEDEEEGAQAQAQTQDKTTKEDEEVAQAQENTTMEDQEEGAQTQAQAQVQAQENRSWAKGGYKAAKRKASDTLSNARKKISSAETSHGGEL